MKLRSLRLRLFRSVREEIELSLEEGLTVVGPNNSGKSNIMRGIQMFFTGRQNQFEYSRDEDLTFGVGAQRTSMVMSFRAESKEKDGRLLNKYRELAKMMGVPREPGDMMFSVYLEFSVGSNPIYKLFPTRKRPTGAEGARYSKKLALFIDSLIDQRFEVVYVPSDKDFEDLFDELALPLARKLIAKSLAEHADIVSTVLSQASAGITRSLAEAGIPVQARLQPPDDDLTNLIGPVELMLADPQMTSVYDKGMGIQAATLLSTLTWIDSQLRADGRDVIWLIEEPEAFLHPELAGACESILAQLQSSSQVVRTTHSLSFVPDDPGRVLGTRLNSGFTAAEVYNTSREAGEHIRQNLGVLFSDFFSLGRYNIGLEGPSDREMMRWMLRFIDANFHDGREGIEVLFRDDCRMFDFGGVRMLQSFLLANYGHVSKERAFVSVFDGDDAGVRAVRAMHGYFGKSGVPFQLSENYLFVRNGFPIEALFPDEWTRRIHASHPSWFDEYEEDVSGAVVAFKYRDGRKRRAMRQYLTYAMEADLESGWYSRWDHLFRALSEALVKLDARLRV